MTELTFETAAPGPSCTLCPTWSSSPQTSDNITDCTCNPGYTGPDGGPCTACVAGKYKPASGSEPCTLCDAGKSSTSVSATSSGTCNTCPGRTYDSDDRTQCLACPSDSNSPSLSDEITDCRCNVGYTGPDGGPCAACIAGKYKTQTGSATCTLCNAGQYSNQVGASSSGTCVNCPTGTYSNAVRAWPCSSCASDSNSPSASDDFSDCLCNVGYTGPDGGPCTACVPGKYKTVTGAAACQDCPVGYYHSSAARWFSCLACSPGKYANETGSSTCRDCPANSASSSSGSDWCLCNRGYSGPDGGPCTACEPGKFKTVSGSGACQACPAGAYHQQPGQYVGCSTCVAGKYANGTGNSFCRDCASGSFSNPNSQFRTDCKCNVGYTGPDGEPCDACAAGKYKTQTGSGTCTLCNAGQYSNQVGASSSGTCVNCPTGTYSNAVRAWPCSSCASDSNSPSASDDFSDCLCNVGYTGPDGGPCTACVPGKYKTVTGAAACQDCVAGYYHQLPGASQDCSFCIPGKYTNGTGSSTCQDCPANSYSYSHVLVPTQSLVCASGTGLYCQAYFSGLDQGPAQVQYTSTPDLDSGTPVEVTIDVIQTDYDGSNEYLDIVSVGPGDITYCTTCAGPFIYSGGIFDNSAPASSAVDFLKNDGNSNHQSVKTIMTSQPVPAGAISANGRMAVILKASSEVNVNPYTDANGVNGKVYATVRVTPAGASQSSTDCVCNLGYYGPDGGPCTACAAGKYAIIASNANMAAAGVQNIGQGCYTACGSQPGFCTFCGTGACCRHGESDLLNGCDGTVGIPGMGEVCTAPRCIDCAAGMYSTALAATSPTTCQLCLAGKYANGTGNTFCRDCPSYTVSPVGSDERADCVCDLGYSGPNGGPCTACVVGKFKPVTGPSQCTACSPGTYQTMTAQSVCLACPSDSHSNAESPLLMNCTCNVGFFGPDGGPCTACPAGTYKDVSGTAACALCPAGKFSTGTGRTSESTCVECPQLTFSVQGSSTIMNCSCRVGYSGYGHNCSACAAGTYKDNRGSDLCLDCKSGTYSPAAAKICQMCPENSFSSPNSIDVTNCSCNAGYTGAPGSSCTLDISPQARTALVGLSASVTAAVSMSLGASILAGVMSPILAALTLGLVEGAEKDRAMNIVYLLYHVQFLTFLEDVGSTSPAVHSLAESFRWSLLDINLFNYVNFDIYPTAGDPTQNRRLSPQNCSTINDLLRITERLVTCACVFVSVILMRMALRAVLSRLFPSHKDWSDMEYPTWEIPTAFFLFWGVADVLANVFGNACSLTSQLVAVSLLICGPVLLVVSLVFQVLKLQCQGILQYHQSTALKWSELRESLRGSSCCNSLKLFRGWLKSNRFDGAWGKEDPRIQRLYVLLENYNNSFVVYFAFQMVKQVGISFAVTIASSPLRVLALVGAQSLDTLLLFCFLPFSDVKNNIVECICVVSNTIAVLFLAYPVYNGAQFDDLLLVILSSFGTMVVALASLAVMIEGLIEQFMAMRRAFNNKVHDLHEKVIHWHDKDDTELPIEVAHAKISKLFMHGDPSARTPRDHLGASDLLSFNVALPEFVRKGDGSTECIPLQAGAYWVDAPDGSRYQVIERICNGAVEHTADILDQGWQVGGEVQSIDPDEDTPRRHTNQVLDPQFRGEGNGEAIEQNHEDSEQGKSMCVDSVTPSEQNHEDSKREKNNPADPVMPGPLLLQKTRDLPVDSPPPLEEMDSDDAAEDGDEEAGSPLRTKASLNGLNLQPDHAIPIAHESRKAAEIIDEYEHNLTNMLQHHTAEKYR